MRISDWSSDVCSSELPRKMAIYASVYGGLFSTLVLVVLAPQIAAFALRFGPAEMAALLLFSLTVVGVLSGGSMAKGLFSGALGLALATIGAEDRKSTRLNSSH